MAEGQEKSEFAKQNQGFFLAFGQGLVILFFVGVLFSQYDNLEGAHSFVALLEANLLLFALLFGYTYKDGLYTLGWYINLAAKEP